jgi:aminocarboxymuconate-semialdehyde decarboxylase
MIIDVHAHYLPKLLIERFDAVAFPGVKLLRDDKGTRFQFPGTEPTRPVAPKLMDLGDRKQWLTQNGIDHQLVGGWMDVYGYELSADEGLAWSRYSNRCMKEALAGEPRFTPLATLPLQDGRFAAQVLTEAMADGFGGAMIGTLPKGGSGNLDDASLDPFWEAASSLKAGIFLHPMFPCDARLDSLELQNAIGRIVDASIAVSRLLFSGHLLKFPGVKLVLSHGGAALPFVLGRLARAFDIAHGKLQDPQAGFGALYFDTIVFDRAALEFLAARAGARRLMLGSDMPFPIGDLAPRNLVEQLNLGTDERDAILGGTARNVFRLRPDCAC